MKLKGGSFKTLNLDPRLYHNISFKNPTPIQRKTLPGLLLNQNIIGIARTGSGKTLAFLIPAIQKALSGKKILIVLPTRELVHQTFKVCQKLIHNLHLKVELLYGGTVEKELSNPDIIIGTVGRVRYTDLPHIDFLVVDEVDRIFEEKSLQEDFFGIEEKINKDRQTAYFSATLPEKFIHLVSDFELIRVEEQLNENLQHFFFFVPSSEKEAALLFLLEKIKEKTIIFVKTRHTVEYLAEILKKFLITTIYSAMDQQCREICLNNFIKGKVQILIVTDLASRGLDIPFLDVVINYNMCDTKTFLHRIGRVGRSGRFGKQYSLISYKDTFYFYKIKEKFMLDEEIGSIPNDLLNKYQVEIERMDLKDLRNRAFLGEEKANRFRKPEELENDYKNEIKNILPHSMFKRNDEREKLILQIQGKLTKPKEEIKPVENVYKDRNFIPYRQKNNVFTDCVVNFTKDDFEKRTNLENKREDWRKRKNTIVKNKSKK